MNSTTPSELSAVIARIVPADLEPTAYDQATDAVRALVTTDRPDWAGRLDEAVALLDTTAADRGGVSFAEVSDGDAEAVLDEVGSTELGAWLLRTVSAAFWAGPAGTRSTPRPASWGLVGFDPDPAGGWPAALPVPFDAAGLITPDRLQTRYDVIVVGSGAGGGIAAQVMAESGRTVLVVEAGAGPATDVLAHDHLRNPRSTFGVAPLTGPSSVGHPRTLSTADGDVTLHSYDNAFNNNAFTVGGGTRVYGAQAWRFSPRDFTMATDYGVPEGSALADWPISYDDLEPFYTEVEQRFGVSGRGGDDPWAGPRSAEYPMPPLPPVTKTGRLRAAAEKLGWQTTAVPLMINSTEYRGRSGCVRCPMCVGFACPVEAKGGSHNVSLPAALATGRTHLLPETTAERLVADARGRVTGVALAGESGGSVWRQVVDADEVIVAAGATESARLLLNSPTEQEPNGIGNNTDQVGRHLQGHVYGGAMGVFDDAIMDLLGPGVSIATCDFRHGNPGHVGGGMIADEFVPTPANSYDYLVGFGLIPAGGRASVEGMRHLAGRTERVMGPVQEVSSADSRVRVDPRLRDRFGNPAARLSGSVHREDLRNRALLIEKAAEWLTAAGATQVVSMAPQTTSSTPSGGQHQAGTCRMGSDPATSVVDPLGRVWGHENLRVADGSVHVTNGGVNPFLSIMANSLRISTLAVS